MANNNRLLLLQYIEHTYHVTNQVKQRIGCDIGWPVGLTVPSLVGNYHVIAGRGQGRYLRIPRIPEFRKTVAEQDQWAASLLYNVHVQTVCSDETMRYRLCRLCSDMLFIIHNISFRRFDREITGKRITCLQSLYRLYHRELRAGGVFPDRE